MYAGPVDARDLQDRRNEMLAAGGVEVTQVGNGPRSIASAAKGLRKGLARVPRSDQVLHCHNAATALAGTLGTRGAPLVLTIHNTEVNFPRPLWRVISHRVAALAAVSEASRQSVARYTNRQIQVIGNGINLAEYAGEVRLFDARRVSLLAVGNLRPEKNYDRLLSSFHHILPILTELGTQAELSIAGEGKERAKLEERITDLGLEGKVRLLGVRDDIAQLMSESDIFVMSSDHEGQPIALLEALSSGLPSVVTPFPAASDVLKDGEAGAIAYAFTTEALAEALIHTIQDAELRLRFSEEGITRAQDFSIRHCADEYIKLYGSVL
jgi:glycosyltransferase involved in cell wall biosynthesis